MIKVHECVSFLLVDDAQVLLEKRAKDKTCDPDIVAIPSGHIEVGESQKEALLREIQEELGVTPKSYHYLCSLYHPTTELQLLHYYVVSYWEGSISSFEAAEVFWCNLSEAHVDTLADKVALSEYHRLKGSPVLPSLMA
ncbi:8-oxo-dGTP diphosphatase [Vibrio ruber DSM 16370]|uniref:8-oxo-dGTP diphosphatase n=1 Tax=Vibrio ruber (strain DSM 16370 / JCM 11486 / BCRC 17186 / CECT 7878 / LMG 23124 / VR1) TaxID=1123498 RepID=A0A1R4LT24_VIBR1|nr:NUDIX domain-containing protein [Vibrio ruber]SJN59751.1 8-oxo-dGTP diphosphatase [Vibrio ruber DSM 16370]